MNYSQRLRSVRLRRRHGEAFGFALRGGREHNLGFYVSHVEPRSEAETQGLKLGDQVVRINGFPIEDALHHEVLSLIKAKTHLRLKVRSTGVLPVVDSDQQDGPWGDARGDFYRQNSSASYRLSSTSTSSSSSSASASSSSHRSSEETTKIYITLARSDALGCTVSKGPLQRPGIFVQTANKGGIAYGVGLRPGDQILQCNGRNFNNVAFVEAVRLLKESRQLDLTIVKGAGLDLFPGESSGYNSSTSSVNGDQSPVQDDKKRLSVVREEHDALDERRLIVQGSVLVDTSKDWGEIEKEWTQAELHQQGEAVQQRRFSSDSVSTLKDESHKAWTEKLQLEAAQQSLELETQLLAQERVVFEEAKLQLERQRSSLTSVSSSDSESSISSKKQMADARLALQHDLLMEEFKEAQRNRLSLEETPETVQAVNIVNVQSRRGEPESVSMPPPPSIPAPPPPQPPKESPAPTLKKTTLNGSHSASYLPAPDYEDDATLTQPLKSSSNMNQTVRPGKIEEVVLRKVATGPAKVSIGAYAFQQDRPSPTKLDFLPANNNNTNSSARHGQVNARDQLQVELAETLSRARLRQRQEGEGVTPLPPSPPPVPHVPNNTAKVVIRNPTYPVKDETQKASTVAARRSLEIPKTSNSTAYLNPKANTMNVKTSKITTNADGKEEFLIEKSVRIRPGLRLANGELNLAGLRKFGVKKPAPGIQAVLDALGTVVLQQQQAPEGAVTSPKSPVPLQSIYEGHNGQSSMIKVTDNNTVSIALNGKVNGILKQGHKSGGSSFEAPATRTISFGKTTSTAFGEKDDDHR